MHIWSSNIYTKYLNMYIMPYDCLQHFCFNFFTTFIDNIMVNLVLYKHGSSLSRSYGAGSN